MNWRVFQQSPGLNNFPHEDDDNLSKILVWTFVFDFLHEERDQNEGELRFELFSQLEEFPHDFLRVFFLVVEIDGVGSD